jgi:hypothetical protein
MQWIVMRMMARRTTGKSSLPLNRNADKLDLGHRILKACCACEGMVQSSIVAFDIHKKIAQRMTVIVDQWLP